MLEWKIITMPEVSIKIYIGNENVFHIIFWPKMYERMMSCSFTLLTRYKPKTSYDVTQVIMSVRLLEEKEIYYLTKYILSFKKYCKYIFVLPTFL